ncbi:MAG: hypothetical protein KDB74_06585, partial [Flavobacteriales bacterium]|nr:hypothetical protein [Flavobacteriales bacterium]
MKNVKKKDKNAMSNYFVVKTREQLDEVVNYLLQSEGIIAIDTETTSADSFSCQLMGVSISVAHEEAFYIPLRTYDKTLIEMGVYFENKIKTLLRYYSSNKNVQLIMHNSPFDIWVVRNCLGIDLLPQLYCDTMLLKHTVDEARPHGLKPTLVRYLGEGWDQSQLDLKENVIAKGGKWVKDQKDMWMGELDILGNYACADADGTRQLFYVLDMKLVEDGLQDLFYKDEVMPLNEVVIDHLLKYGVYCDIEYFTELKQKCEQRIIDLDTETNQCLQNELGPHFETLEWEILNKEVPLTPRGEIAKILLDYCGVPVPKDKDGNKLYSVKAVKTMFEDYPENNILKWKLGVITTETLIELEEDLVDTIRRKVYTMRKGSSSLINLNSPQHLSEVLFNYLGETPSEVTTTGRPKTDKTTLEQYADKYKFIHSFLEKKKEEKLLSTYIENILSKHKENIIRPSWLQAGTDSSRFACRDINLMNLPKNDKRIKYGI